VCLHGLRQTSSSQSQVVGPSPTGASPGFGTPGVQAGTPNAGNQTPNHSNGTDLVPNDGLTDDNINPSWGEIEGFFAKDDSVPMDTTDSLDTQSTSVQKEGDSPATLEEPVTAQTPSALNPASPAPLVSTPSAGVNSNGISNPGDGLTSGALMATPELIMSSWPSTLMEPALPLPIDTIEQYFALCDDSRHDIALALVFEGTTVKLQMEALLAFCAWCRVQASAHATKVNLQQHKLSYRLLKSYDRILAEGERTIFDQLDAHRNTIMVSEGSLPSMDPLQAGIPNIIQQMANIDNVLASAKYASRSQRDHAMQYLDISLPRARFLENNFFLDPHSDALSQRKSFVRPAAYSASLFSKLSISYPSVPTRTQEWLDAVTKFRFVPGRDCRICSNCNRVASFSSASAVTSTGIASKDGSSWIQNWISKCPCCNGVWYFAY
jgi:hypothetical protein